MPDTRHWNCSGGALVLPIRTSSNRIRLKVPADPVLLFPRASIDRRHPNDGAGHRFEIAGAAVQRVGLSPARRVRLSSSLQVSWKLLLPGRPAFTNRPALGTLSPERKNTAAEIADGCAEVPTLRGGVSGAGVRRTTGFNCAPKPDLLAPS
jgi:hypothetical protein